MYNTCNNKEVQLLEKIDSFNQSCVIFTENLNAIANVIEEKQEIDSHINLVPSISSMDQQITRMKISYDYLKSYHKKQGVCEKRPMQTALKLLEISFIVTGVALVYFTQFLNQEIGYASLGMGWSFGQIAHLSLLKRTCKLELYQQSEKVLAREGLIDLSIAICKIIKKIQVDKKIQQQKEKRKKRSVNYRLIQQFSDLRRTINRKMEEIPKKYSGINTVYRTVTISSDSSNGDVDSPLPRSSSES